MVNDTPTMQQYRPLSHSRSRSIDTAMPSSASFGMTRSHASGSISTIASGAGVLMGDGSATNALASASNGPREARRLAKASNGTSADEQLTPSTSLNLRDSRSARRPITDDDASSALYFSTDVDNTADETTDHDVIETDKFVWGRDPRGRRMVNQ